MFSNNRYKESETHWFTKYKSLLYFPYTVGNGGHSYARKCKEMIASRVEDTYFWIRLEEEIKLERIRTTVFHWSMPVDLRRDFSIGDLFQKKEDLKHLAHLIIFKKEEIHTRKRQIKDGRSKFTNMLKSLWLKTKRRKKSLVKRKILKLPEIEKKEVERDWALTISHSKEKSLESRTIPLKRIYKNRFSEIPCFIHCKHLVLSKLPPRKE